MSAGTFYDNLKVGQLGESQICEWLKRRGNHILPVYEVSKDLMKTPAGPGVFMSDGTRCVAPDMLIFNAAGVKFIECKTKGTWTWSRKYQFLETGIDLCHYADYLRVQEKTAIECWLLFLQKGGITPGYEGTTPSGLFGESLSYLSKNESHRHENWGRSGMVYWAIGTLKKIDSLDGVLNLG